MSQIVGTAIPVTGSVLLLGTFSPLLLGPLVILAGVAAFLGLWRGRSRQKDSLYAAVRADRERRVREMRRRALAARRASAAQWAAEGNAVEPSLVQGPAVAVAEPAAEPAPEAVGEALPALEPSPEPALEPSPEPDLEPSPALDLEPISEEAPEPISEEAPELIAPEPAEPITEEAAEPLADTLEPVAETPAERAPVDEPATSGPRRTPRFGAMNLLARVMARSTASPAPSPPPAAHSAPTQLAPEISTGSESERPTSPASAADRSETPDAPVEPAFAEPATLPGWGEETADEAEDEAESEWLPPAAELTPAEEEEEEEVPFGRPDDRLPAEDAEQLPAAAEAKTETSPAPSGHAAWEVVRPEPEPVAEAPASLPAPDPRGLRRLLTSTRGAFRRPARTPVVTAEPAEPAAPAVPLRRAPWEARPEPEAPAAEAAPETPPAAATASATAGHELDAPWLVVRAEATHRPQLSETPPPAAEEEEEDGEVEAKLSLGQNLLSYAGLAAALLVVALGIVLMFGAGAH